MTSLKAATRRFTRLAAVALLCALATTSTTFAQAPAGFAPAGWDAGVTLAEPADLNPDPHVLEVNIVARIADVAIAPGQRVTAWTYNGGLPGPLIRLQVGDRFIAHFKNELPQPTTIHWHGVRVPIEMDGVPDISQPEVVTGSTFTYDFIVPDAGLFWYHPHVMSAAQVGYGLYGAMLVEDPADAVGVADQVTLVLSDIGFDAKSVLEPADSGGSAGMVFGREGTYVLVNGKSRPTLRARAGAPQRWRIVNTAKSRFFYLDLDGQPLLTIGSDGGLLEHPVTSEVLLVAAGERADVIVTPTGAPGSTLVLRSVPYNRGYGSTAYRGAEDLLAIEFTKQPPLPKQKIADTHRTMTPPSAEGATKVDITLTLPPVDNGHSEFRVNGVPYWKAKPYLAKLGETQLWAIKNETDWDHPFHLHGFFFMPVDERGAPVHPMAWKDTMNVPMKTTRRFLVTFDERPGTWMFHCHILDHAEGGLMGTVQLGDVATEHTHPKKP